MWDGPYGNWGSRKYLLASLDQSLRRMGLDYVDIYYSHRPDPRTPIEETMGALATAVTSGKALYAGISNYSAEATKAAKSALEHAGIPLLIHQPSYSMFNRRAEVDLLPTLGELGVGCIVFSPLAQGLLTDRYLGGVPADSRGRREGWAAGGPGEVYLNRVRELQKIATSRGQTVAQLALSWVLRHPQVTSAVIGASSVDQLEDNLAATRAPALGTEELARIDDFAVDGTTLTS